MNVFGLLFPDVKRLLDEVAFDRIRYVVLACEEGGRWGSDVFEVVSDLVRLKVAPLHPPLQHNLPHTPGLHNHMGSNVEDTFLSKLCQVFI